LETVTRDSAFLAAVSNDLASSLEYDAVLELVARAAIPTLADWCAVDVLAEDGSIERLAVADIDPVMERASRDLALHYLPRPTAIEGVPKVLRSGRAELITDLGAAPDSEHAELMRRLGLATVLILPLTARERTLGALSLATVPSRPQWCETDLALADDLASRCALAIDNARLYRLAREAIELRDTYLATISHDLKNPLATISGQAQLLRRVLAGQEGLLGGRVGENLQRMEVTVQWMARMIDGLLDVTRVELGGRLELERAPMDLAEVARRLALEYQQRTTRHVVQVAGDPELVGQWDLARLERALDNLVSNAVKYSPTGTVVTIVCVREDDDTGAWAILSVRDQGLGVPEPDLGHIFERFHRAGNVGAVGGAGIGLATVREIVQLHGGSITVESRPGQGSTFTVRLPLAPPSGP
jgi:signal transduction histidine kinase